jgi:hypothetical protein
LFRESIQTIVGVTCDPNPQIVPGGQGVTGDLETQFLE